MNFYNQVSMRRQHIPAGYLSDPKEKYKWDYALCFGELGRVKKFQELDRYRSDGEEKAYSIVALKITRCK
ncbi:hypothetical protein RCL_jg693.t1 [Rhizophagus clarus]|uniref:Uncharacterized protein n=1 Tax=Rhizophagus clarus TaxID=94130 RepID=A0A8H3QJZ0_9GLOM|nr:hypothetical protein RCL_jg693.t1 [Rhizophagus clarus]